MRQTPTHETKHSWNIDLSCFEFVSYFVLRISCLTFLIYLAGCGGPAHPDVGRVSGVVTLDGQPLPDATVMFQPTSGRASVATTDKTGKYSLVYLDGVPGALLGAHKVIIRTEIPGEDGQPPIAKEKLPKKYHDQTELTAEVKPQPSTINFELQSPAGGAKK
jgi:hypothetical protein